ncbi:hypothetical protein D9757_014333 [Collybiopsis confluens]|uniref:Large ribosomal subunit protein uL15/eL18 domain-containing protein n=1 Tax=Collybiopsis confluens TaxID=2823264 RepID=A0A8H5D695_9AGAR|nr:hypothetical protein D9757_014333 [Collybiopsis confluens]
MELDCWPDFFNASLNTRQICLGSVRQQELAVVLSNFALAHFNRILPCQLCLGSTAAGYALGFVSQPPGDSFQSHSTSSPFPGQHQVVGYVLDFVSHPPGVSFQSHFTSSIFPGQHQVVGYVLDFVSQPPGVSFQSHSTSLTLPGQCQVAGYVLGFVSQPPAHCNRIFPRQLCLGSTRLLDTASYLSDPLKDVPKWECRKAVCGSSEYDKTSHWIPRMFKSRRGPHDGRADALTQYIHKFTVDLDLLINRPRCLRTKEIQKDGRDGFGVGGVEVDSEGEHDIPLEPRILPPKDDDDEPPAGYQHPFLYPFPAGYFSSSDPDNASSFWKEEGVIGEALQPSTKSMKAAEDSEADGQSGREHSEPTLTIRLTRRAKLLSAVGTVIDDIRIPSTNIPKLTIATLRFTQSAKACILAAGGQVLTLDELALHAPPEATPSFLGGIGTKERL